MNENWHKFIRGQSTCVNGTTSFTRKQMDIGIMVSLYNRTYVLLSFFFYFTYSSSFHSKSPMYRKAEERLLLF